MFKYTIFLLVAWIHLSSTKIHKLLDFEAYYWRDFDGVIPSDAFAVETYTNQKLYITQVLHKSLLIPATLDDDLRMALYEYDGKGWSTNKNIKIFCTKFPQLFEWSQVNSSNFINDKNYVVAGFEPKRSVFIGKGIKDDHLFIGKVIFDKGITTYLHCVQNQKALIFKSYEVLTFTPMILSGANIYSLASTTGPPSNVIYPHEAYYWRDFKGVIPMDAFSAGLNSGGAPTYVVQVLYKEFLTPGYLRKDSKYAIFEYGSKQWDTSDNLKILCTNLPQFLHWQKTDTCRFSSSTVHIIGGDDSDQPVFIGRATKENEVLVGKIDNSNLPLLYTIFNYEAIRLKFFEALVFSNEKVSTLPYVANTTKQTTARPKTSSIPNTTPVYSKEYFPPPSTTTKSRIKYSTVDPHLYDEIQRALKNLSTSQNNNIDSKNSKLFIVSSHANSHNTYDTSSSSLNINKVRNKLLLQSEQRVIDSHLYDELRVALMSSSKNQNNNCDCGKRVYIINVN